MSRLTKNCQHKIWLIKGKTDSNSNFSQVLKKYIPYDEFEKKKSISWKVYSVHSEHFMPKAITHIEPDDWAKDKGRLISNVNGNYIFTKWRFDLNF